VSWSRQTAYRGAPTSSQVGPQAPNRKGHLLAAPIIAQVQYRVTKMPAESTDPPWGMQLASACARLWLESAAASPTLKTEVHGTELNISLAPDPGPSRDDAMADPCSGSTSLLEFRRFVRPTLLRSAAVPGSVAPGAVSCNALLGRLRERAPRMSLSRSCAALESALLRLVVCLLGFGRHQTLNHLVRDAKEFADVAPAELQVMS
jgi:hypothetical protein